jgi:hypothetical protein
MESKVRERLLSRGWNPKNAKLAAYYADLLMQQVTAIVPITVSYSGHDICNATHTGN